MTIKIKERNKALVLEAFDTPFNKRDYKAAERFWSPNYIQHCAHIPPGREGLFNLVRRMPTTLRYEAGVILADEDFVFVRGRFSDNRRPRNWIAADVVRIADGLLVEHLEVLQDEATRDESQSGRPVFGGEFPSTGETSGRALCIR
jgi:predicted SnoaL-like aldol condensation-catalyzing enzyme